MKVKALPKWQRLYYLLSTCRKCFIFCLLVYTHTCGKTFHVKRSPILKLYPNATQPSNCFSYFWSDATVLVALLVDHTKGRSPQKGHLWPRNYTTHTQLCQEFLPRFFKKVFLHTVPTILKLGVLLRCIACNKNKAILNCRIFAFALKMILNLILKLNLKMNSNSKLVLNLILNLILNLKMFRLWRARASRET